MRRLARRLFTLCSAASMLLCVGVCVLWVRSYWTADVAGVTRQVPTAHARLLWSANGYVTYRHQASPPGARTVYPSPGWVHGHGPAKAMDEFVLFGGNVHRFLGVTYADNVWKSSRGGPLNGEREILVQVPYWLLLAATGALPVGRLLARRVRRAATRSAAGLCTHCGYDLRATPGRCPECGALAPPGRAAADG